MMDAILRATANNFQKARAVNATDTSFASKVYTLTPPTGTGVIELVRTTNRDVASRVLCHFFGVGDNDGTFDVRVIGWRKLGSTWISTILFEARCTLSTFTGIAGGDILDTEKVADTIVQVSAYDAQADKHFSILAPGANLPASLELNTRGSTKLEFIFDIIANVTSMNATVAEL